MINNIRYDNYSSKDKGYTIYSVYGEDPNADMSGYHVNPFLGNVEGTFDEVIEYAAEHMPNFYTWGGGGYILPYKSLKQNADPIILNKVKKLKIERKAKLNNFVTAEIDNLIDNINILSKDDIKQILIEIKNKMI